jgi:copper(I)-binding protein
MQPSNLFAPAFSFWLSAWRAVVLALLLPCAAFAHGSSKGDLRVDHSYATVGSTEAVVYFRSIRNEGDQPDRLLGGDTSVAAAVELQRIALEGGAKTASAVTAIELPVKANIAMRHDKGEYRILLKGLKLALKDGDRFDLNLNFEKAGTLAVKVWVQAMPQGAHGDLGEHTH